jgi:lauroyl/myristoyl acyltransferase
MNPQAASPPSVSPPRWHAHPYNRRAYYRLGRTAAPWLPAPARRWLAVRVARACRSRFPHERVAVGRNLARVWPDHGAEWLEHAVDRVFENFAVCFADVLSLNRQPPHRRWTRVSGIEQAPTRAALARGRGCVSITAHLGNWDLAGRALAALGPRVHIVMAPEVDPTVETMLAPDGDGGLRVVRLRSPLGALELVGALRRGEIVAFQMDRALGGRGDGRALLFGAPAAFPLGPFAIAAAAGSPVVPAFCLRQPGGRYRLHVEPAFDVARGEEQQGLEHTVRLLEGQVRAYWDQWFNFFDVWGGIAGE